MCYMYLKAASQLDGSFEHRKLIIKTDWSENIYKFTLNNFVYLNLWLLIKLPKVNNKGALAWYRKLTWESAHALILKF